MLITVLLGFVGGDHLWLRSPVTAILKLIVNVFTLGSWYVYDIIQIFKDREKVLKYGLSIPVVGAEGIAAGVFIDNPDGTKKEATAKSPFKWLAYLALLWLPLGLDSLVGGDLIGALAKFISTFNPFMWLILIIWKMFDYYNTIVSPTVLWEKGIVRFFPFSLFIDAYHPTKMGPLDPIPSASNQFSNLGVIGEAFGLIAKPVIEEVISPVTVSVGAVTGAVTAVAEGVKNITNAAVNITNAAVGTTVPVISTVRGVVNEVPKAINAIPQIVGQTTQSLNALKDPKMLANLAATQGIKGAVQGAATQGVQGALMKGGSYNSDVLSGSAIAITIGVLFIGGIIISGLKLKAFLHQNKHGRNTERNDVPYEAQ